MIMLIYKDREIAHVVKSRETTINPEIIGYHPFARMPQHRKILCIYANILGQTIQMMPGEKHFSFGI
jgi:hypothetical protein